MSSSSSSSSSTSAAVAAIQARAAAEGRAGVTPAGTAFALGFAAGQRVAQRRKLARLSSLPQNYAWGRVGMHSKVAQLMAAAGLPVDETRPYAEYWFGTHAAAPSSLAASASARSDQAQQPQQLLSEWLAARPEAMGGLAGADGGELVRTGQLPFLLKVLSVAKALSIQAHPDKALAERLHAARPDVYKDPNHKPEMAVALTRFEAMCGFRPMAQLASHILGVAASASSPRYPEFAALVGPAAVQAFRSSVVDGADAESQKAALRAVFTAWMKCGAAELDTQLTAMLARLRQLQEAGKADAVELLMLRLSEQYPGDVGIFAPIMLNYLQLEPGQAIFLAANEPHAYLDGDIVECMACSNNVVRAGLTPKLRDVDTLCEMLTYTCYDPKDLLVRPQVRGHTVAYVPPIDEFVITRVDLPAAPAGDGDTAAAAAAAAPVAFERLEPRPSPALLLVTKGTVELSGEAAGAGTVLLEVADEARALPLEAVAAGRQPAQLFRVFAKEAYGRR